MKILQHRDFRSFVVVAVVFGGVLNWLSIGVEAAPVIQPSCLSPIVIIPGFTGSRLHASVNNASPPCPTEVRDTVIWASADSVQKETFDCWTSIIKLNYDAKERKSYSNPGVTVTVPGFGETETVETQGPHPSAAYFSSFVETAVKNWGYERGKNIRAAPYDWRKAPNEQAEYFPALKQLIEDTFERNGQKRISLVAHSMGNIYTLYFLHRQSLDWLQRYLTTFYSIGAPWAGVTVTALMTASGFLSFPAPDILKLRALQRTLPANYLLLPTSDAWHRDEPIIVNTGGRNYSVVDFEQLFRDLGITEVAVDLYQTVAIPKLLDIHKPPGVKTYCLIGTNLPTPARFIYSEGRFPDLGPDSLVYEDGDGMVPTRSGQLCKEWWRFTLSGHPPVNFTTLPNVSHNGLITDKVALNLLQQLIVSEK